MQQIGNMGGGQTPKEIKTIKCHTFYNVHMSKAIGGGDKCEKCKKGFLGKCEQGFRG